MTQSDFYDWVRVAMTTLNAAIVVVLYVWNKCEQRAQFEHGVKLGQMVTQHPTKALTGPMFDDARQVLRKWDADIAASMFERAP